MSSKVAAKVLKEEEDENSDSEKSCSSRSSNIDEMSGM